MFEAIRKESKGKTDLERKEKKRKNKKRKD